MLRIAIVIGSTRPGRKGEAVARWVHELAARRTDAAFELIDLLDYGLPLLDEPLPASQGQYSQPHTLRWAAKVATFDGFVFVTPEYNQSTCAALKNAIDFLYAEWNNKAAAFVGYGAVGATRAVAHLRQVMAELRIADIRTQVALTLREDFENFAAFKPRAHHDKGVTAMLDELIAWSAAMKTLRPLANAT
jgi:NAD(P)H-dependent FMN reductase